MVTDPLTQSRAFKKWYYMGEGKEKRAKYYKEWASKNKDKRRLYKIRNRQNNVEKYIFLEARSRAKRKNIPFDITIDDIYIPPICPLLNEKLTLPGINKIMSPSIDRIDNSKGYIKGNIRIISLLANRMKNAATDEQLIVFATNILKSLGK